MTYSDGIGTLSLLFAVIALGVAYCQLQEANDSLSAANTISLSHDARDVAENIASAGDDAQKLNNAYDRYGDFLAHSGYLAGKGGIPVPIWDNIKSDFCEFYKNKAFKLWYARNQRANHILSLYPDFERLEATCK